MVGCLASINSIHQWPVIKLCLFVFELNTCIHVLGHVPSSICVEDLILWCHSIYATTLIMMIPMGFHFSYQRSVPYHVPDVFIQYGDQTSLCIVCGCDHLWHLSVMPIHGHCTYMYLGLLYILQICSHVYRFIIILCWQMVISLTRIFTTPLLGLL